MSLHTERVAYSISSVRTSKDGSRLYAHYGRIADIEKALRARVAVKDKRAKPVVPRRYDLRMVNHPRDNQQALIDGFIAARLGIGAIRAPTGFGKTFVGIAIAVELGLRTLVLMSKTNWIEVWLKDLRKHTNITKVEKRCGHPVAGIIDSSTRLDALFPTLNFATFQSFMRTGAGKNTRRDLRDCFGLVIADEIVELPAEQTSRVFTSFNAARRLGLSADEKRKDKKHRLTYDYCGPVVAQGEFTTRQAGATVFAHNPGTIIYARSLYYGHNWFGSLCTKVARCKKMFEEIIDNVIEDVEDGYCTLVLAGRREHALNLANVLSKEKVRRRNRKTGKLSRRPLKVTHLLGGDHRQKQKIKAAGERKYDCLVAMDRCIGKNTDLPGIDSLHDFEPTNNTPAIKQRTGRTLRAYIRCRDCMAITTKHTTTCFDCGSSNLRSLKKTTLRIHVYWIELSPFESAPGRCVSNGWQARIAFYESLGFDTTEMQKVSAASQEDIASKQNSIMPFKG